MRAKVRCLRWTPAIVIKALSCLMMALAADGALADAPYAGTPYSGAPFTIAGNGPSRLEAADFDKGGEGIAYHDTDPANAGKQYRPDEGVDISACNDVGGGNRIGFIATGEWLKYTVQVQQAGKYDISLRISSRGSAGSAGKLHLENASGTDLTGPLSVPGTSNAWSDLVTKGIQLPAGQQVLTLKFDAGGFNLSHITFTPAEASAPAAADAGNPEVVVIDAGAPAPTTPAAAAPEAPPTPFGVFAGAANIGTPKPSGKLSVASGGSYSLRGGAKIGATADSFYFVNGPATDGGQLVAHVESIEGPGSAGIMLRDSISPDAKYAAVLVTAANGVIFQRRAEKGAAATSAVAISARPPVWIRLSHSGSDFIGSYATTAEAPTDADWKQIGSPKTVTLSETARTGLAAALDTGSAVVTNISADAVAAPPAAEATAGQQPAAVAPSGQPGKLTGQVIGTPGGYKDSTTREKAFDGDLNTYFDPSGTADPNTTWCGLDFGTPRRITRICYAPRTGWENRMIGGRFEASDSPTFASGMVQLATIATAPPAGRLTTLNVDSARPYRYFRYVGGTGHLHVGEIEVYGTDGGGAPAAAGAPAGAAAPTTPTEPVAVADITGKTINLSDNAIDWVHWGASGPRMDRKAGVTARISDVDPARSDSFPDNHSSYSWSDGTPTRQITASATGIYRTTSFRFTVKPGDTQPHTLTVYLGAAGGKGDLVATMGGTVVYADRGRGDTGGGRFYVAHTIKFRASRPTEILTVEWRQTAGTGNIQLHAAQLQ